MSRQLWAFVQVYFFVFCRDRKFDFEVCSVTSNCNEHHPPTGQGLVTITIPSAPATTSQQRNSTGISHLVIG